MKQAEVMIEGRRYWAYVSEEDSTPGGAIVIGPPEGLVDTLGLTSELATRLHNILYDRKIFKYEDAIKRGAMQGVMQELFALDAQVVLEKFNEFQTEKV